MDDYQEKKEKMLEYPDMPDDVYIPPKPYRKKKRR